MKLTTRVLLFFLCTSLLVKPLVAETPPAGATIRPPTNYFGVSVVLGVAALYCTYCYLVSKGEQIQKDTAEKVALANKKLESETFTFRNLAGAFPQDVTEIIDFIKNSEKYNEIGAVMPRGILLVGPPGTGKTSIARAIAGEVGANFFAASATHFIESYIGVGCQRIRELFDTARKNAQKSSKESGKATKSIIFIDELDAVGIKRAGHVDAGSREYSNTLNELLNQIDGFTQDSSVFVIAATNRVEDLDPALIRSGRFDRIVYIGNPDAEGRKSILSFYAQKIKHEILDLDRLVRETDGKSAADLKNLVNQAAIYAVREDAPVVTQRHFEQALHNFRVFTR